MLRSLLILTPLLLVQLFACGSTANAPEGPDPISRVSRASDATRLERVATIEGVQVTGITVTQQGRIFATFPRWRAGVPFTLAEIIDGQPVPYPSADLNAWDIGQEPGDQLVSVQSAVAVGNLEGQAVVLIIDDGRITRLVEGEDVGWADTFSAYDGYLYFTNSKLPEARQEVSGMSFPIWRMPLPGR